MYEVASNMISRASKTNLRMEGQSQTSYHSGLTLKTRACVTTRQDVEANLNTDEAIT
jgi:hypothetical protein